MNLDSRASILDLNQKRLELIRDRLYRELGFRHLSRIRAVLGARGIVFP